MVLVRRLRVRLILLCLETGIATSLIRFKFPTYEPMLYGSKVSVSKARAIVNETWTTVGTVDMESTRSTTCRSIPPQNLPAKSSSVSGEIFGHKLVEILVFQIQPVSYWHLSVFSLQIWGILSIFLKWLVIFQKFWILIGYYSNSTGSSESSGRFSMSIDCHVEDLLTGIIVVMVHDHHLKWVASLPFQAAISESLLRYVGVIWLFFHVLQLLSINSKQHTYVALANL